MSVPKNSGGKSALRVVKKVAYAPFAAAGWVAATTPVKLARNLTARALTDIAPMTGGFIGRRIESTDSSNLLSHSPYEQQKLLDRYSQSYDLTQYEKLAGDAAVAIKKSSSALLTQKTVNVLQFGELGKSIDKNSEKLPERQARLASLHKAISEQIQPSNLIAKKDGVRDNFRALQQAIKQNDPGYQRPQQIINAFNSIHDTAKTNLTKEKEQALKNIEALFAPGERSVFKQDLIYLLDIKEGRPKVEAVRNAGGGIVTPEIAAILPTPDELKSTEDRLNKEKEHMLAAVKQSYEKAEADLQEAFADKPATKDKDGKEIAKVRGLTTKVAAEKERCEVDLLIRARHLERMEAHKYDYRQLQSHGLSVTIGDNLDDDFRKKCLKGKTLKFLEEQYVPGMITGHRTISASKTASGTNLKCDVDGNGNTTKITIKIPGRWFPYHLMGDHRLQSDFNDMVDRVIAKGKEIPAISFEHQYEDEDLRKEVVLCSYKAARAKGFKPEEIRMTVLGGDEKNTFKDKSALEVLQAMGLGDLDAGIQADIDEMQKQKQEITKAKAPQDSFMKSKLESLKNLTPTKDEDGDEAENTKASTYTLGGGGRR